MTDNEIIKALECCKTPLSENTCVKCAFYKTGRCSINMLNATLDLINRQKATIERLQKNIDGLNIFTKNHITVIRLQAIKEFADRLKEEIRCEDDCRYHCYDCCYECKDYVIAVDTLVKSMTEVETNQ